MTPRTFFAPGFTDLFGGIAKPYKKRKWPATQNQEDIEDKAIFRFLRANPMLTATQIAELMCESTDTVYWRLRANPMLTATQIAELMCESTDTVYWRLRMLFKMEFVDYRFEPLSDTEPRKYKKWFVVEEDMEWRGGKS